MNSRRLLNPTNLKIAAVVCDLALEIGRALSFSDEDAVVYGCEVLFGGKEDVRGQTQFNFATDSIYKSVCFRRREIDSKLRKPSLPQPFKVTPDKFTIVKHAAVRRRIN